MANTHINLTWLRSFEAAARHLNFTEASDELGLTQTAVSLHIRSLEARLGAKLFLRRARHLSLTDIGQAYVSTVRAALADIDLASTSLFGPATRQMITIKAPVSTASLWLAPRLPAFKARFAGITLRLVTNIWSEARRPEGIDVELRLGRGDWTDVQSEKLAEENAVLVCPTARAEQIAAAPDQISGPLIHILGQESAWARYLHTHGAVVPEGTPEYFADTTVSALSLVTHGGGLAMVMERLARTPGTLASNITTVGDPIPMQDAHYLMQRKNQRAVRPEVTLFENWLREEFAAGQ